MPQMRFTRDQAAQALEAFLSEQPEQPDRPRFTRTITAGGDALGEEIAVILDPAEYRKLVDDQNRWVESQRPHVDDDLPPGYRPWSHGPEAWDEFAMFPREFPTEPLHDTLARFRWRKPYSELDETQRDAVKGIALTLLCEMSLPADSQGGVPILCYGAGEADDHPRTFWKIAHPTPTHGLFARYQHTGMFGDEWIIISASGLTIPGIYYGKDHAQQVAGEIGRALPNVQWAHLDRTGLSQDAHKALARVLRANPALEITTTSKKETRQS